MSTLYNIFGATILITLIVIINYAMTMDESKKNKCRQRNKDWSEFLPKNNLGKKKSDLILHPKDAPVSEENATVITRDAADNNK